MTVGFCFLIFSLRKMCLLSSYYVEYDLMKQNVAASWSRYPKSDLLYADSVIPCLLFLARSKLIRVYCHRCPGNRVISEGVSLNLVHTLIISLTIIYDDSLLSFAKGLNYQHMPDICLQIVFSGT